MATSFRLCQDLNVSPASTADTILTSEMEPKQEPLDGSFLTETVPCRLEIEPKREPLDGSFQTETVPCRLDYISDSAPDFCNSQTALQPQFCFASASSADIRNIYSSFFRISELFNAAFARQAPFQSKVNTDGNGAIVVSHGKRKKSSELVRFMDASGEQESDFRSRVRRTRMTYDSLRILAMMEEEEENKKNAPGERKKRSRCDLKASKVLSNHGMWLNRQRRFVGQIPGVQIGDVFFYRIELCIVGLHEQPQAGIDYLPASRSPNKEPIATSIIVSGGYEDDVDAGDEIIYTGQGGQDKFSRQCMDQKLESGNLALERSMHYGIEVRVIRGLKYGNNVSSKVYVYDGLYKIIDCWSEVGKSGFKVYKYKLLRITGQPVMGSSMMKLAGILRTEPLSVRPMGYLSLDISMEKDNFPVLLYNDVDNDRRPLNYTYLLKTNYTCLLAMISSGQDSSGTGCNCVSDCTEGCLCAKKNGGEFAYDGNGLLVRGKPVIFECEISCDCPPTCRNRNTQKGLRNRLEIFRSSQGWGVRSLDLIQAGAFICEYAGIGITREQARMFSICNSDDLIYPSRFSQSWAEWGDLSQVFPGYQHPSSPSLPSLDFAIDISKMRNAACYISYSSVPNLMVQYVLYDHMFPHIMLFAMENIPPLRELTLDYRVADESTLRPSICN